MRIETKYGDTSHENSTKMTTLAKFEPTRKKTTWQLRPSSYLLNEHFKNKLMGLKTDYNRNTKKTMATPILKPEHQAWPTQARYFPSRTPFCSPHPQLSNAHNTYLGEWQPCSGRPPATQIPNTSHETTARRPPILQLNDDDDVMACSSIHILP